MLDLRANSTKCNSRERHTLSNNCTDQEMLLLLLLLRYWKTIGNIYVLWTVHLAINLDNDQLDTQLFYFTILNFTITLWSSTYFEHYMLIIRRLNFIDAASGIVTLSKWLSGAQVEREFSLSTYAFYRKTNCVCVCVCVCVCMCVCVCVCVCVWISVLVNLSWIRKSSIGQLIFGTRKWCALWRTY